MFRILLRKQLYEIFRTYFYNAKKNVARSKRTTALFFVGFALLMVVVVGGVFAGLSLLICAPLVSYGAAWLYFAIMGTIAVVLGTFGSAFNTFSELYGAKDNDLLLAMPIPARALVGSRLASVYLMGLLYSSLVAIPAVVVYCIVIGFSASALAGGVALVLNVSLVVFVLSCIVGLVVARLSLRMKNKAISRVLIALACIALYYVIYFGFINSLNEMLENPAPYIGGMQNALSPLYWFGQVGAGDPVAIGICTAVVAMLTVATWVVLERSFLRTATATGASANRAAKRISSKQNSPQCALFKKELGRLLGSSDYMLNCALGVVLLPVLAIYVLVMASMLNEMIAEASAFMPDGFAPMLAFATLCLASTMICTAVPSVSLEGKSLWIVKSLPVDAWHALEAKALLQILLMGAPLLASAVVVAFALQFSVVETALLLVTCAAFVLFVSVADTCLAVKMPILTWTTERVAIKQSGGVLVSLFGGWILIAAIAGLYFWQGWHMGFTGFMAGVSSLLMISEGLLRRWLRLKGVRRFEKL